MSNAQLNKKRILIVIGENEMSMTLERRQKEERKLSTKTEKTYQRLYNHLSIIFNHFFDEYWVVRSSQKDLCENIQSLILVHYQSSTKLSYLNIFIIIKKYHNCKFDLLDNLRNKLMNEVMNEKKRKLIRENNL